MPPDNSTSDPAPKSQSRREFLLWAGRLGGFAAVGALGILTWREVSNGVFATGQGPAYEAWQDWNSPGGSNLELVEAAVLAANAHDSQPWLFELGASTVDLYANSSHNLGAIDPLLREMYVSLGCALENLMLAAPANGLTPSLTLMPDPADQSHVAHIDLSVGQTIISPLYSEIPKRHTNRYPYDTSRPVTSQTLSAMTALIDVPEVNVVWLTSAADMKSFADLTIMATEAFIADPQQVATDFSWYRQDWSQLQTLKDGITPDAAGLPPITDTLSKIVTISAAQDEQAWLSQTENVALATAAAYGVLNISDAQDSSQELEAGRIYERMHLWATMNGLAMQPLNATLERRDREQSAGLAPVITQGLAGLLPDTYLQAVMPFRIGYPTQEAPLSPRIPAEQVLKQG
jgi:nitroreductase